MYIRTQRALAIGVSVKQYSVKFAIDHESIKKAVLYNSAIFTLNSDGDIVSVRNPSIVSHLPSEFEIDNNITNMIKFST